MERFHGFLDLRLEMAVNRAQGRGFFPENDSWHSLRRDATVLLELINPDPDQLRAALVGLIGALVEPSGQHHALGNEHYLLGDNPAG